MFPQKSKIAKNSKSQIIKTTKIEVLFDITNLLHGI